MSIWTLIHTAIFKDEPTPITLLLEKHDFLQIMCMSVRWSVSTSISDSYFIHLRYNFNFYLLHNLCNVECCHIWYFYHCHNKICMVQVKVEEQTGRIALRHFPSDIINENLEKIVIPDTMYFLSVYWLEVTIPSLHNRRRFLWVTCF